LFEVAASTVNVTNAESRKVVKDLTFQFWGRLRLTIERNETELEIMTNSLAEHRDSNLTMTTEPHSILDLLSIFYQLILLISKSKIK
jgi:hypothetical protein